MFPKIFKNPIKCIACTTFLLMVQTTYSQQLVVNSINISGNKITHRRIILRELVFSQGDSIGTARLSTLATKIKENLDNTLLFNFVTVSFDTTRNQVNWNIFIEERWYVWPIPIIEYADRNLSAFLKNGDYTRVNFGAFVKVNNFRGLHENLRIRLVAGHRKQVALQYNTFNLNRNKKHGIETWISYNANNEVAYTSFNNTPIIHRAYEGTVRSTFISEVAYLYRPAHRWYHKFSFTHLQSFISDTIASMNPFYFGNGKTNFQFNQIKYKLINDNRDFKIFPLKGYYFDLEFARMGLFKPDDLKQWFVSGSFRYYKPISSWLYWAFDAMGKKSFTSNFPFFQSDASGFKNYIRGYEYYITNGSGYVLNKNTLNIRIVAPKIVNLPFVPDGKFKKAHFTAFWSFFSDTGYTSNDLTRSEPNLLEGKFLYSLGTGLYLVAYYDIVFRVEYSINRLGESGFFLHFGTPFLND